MSVRTLGKVNQSEGMKMRKLKQISGVGKYRRLKRLKIYDKDTSGCGEKK